MDMKCCYCNNLMSLQKGGRTKIGYRFRCPRPCRKECSILKDSFLEHCNIDLSKMLEFLYNWSNETCSFKNMNREMDVSRAPYVAWRGYCRDICIEAVNKLDYQIGGVGTTVQIDESQFAKRKYNRGRCIHNNGCLVGLIRKLMNVF